MTMTDSFTRDGIQKTRNATQRDANFARAELDKVDWASRSHVMALGMWRVYTTKKLGPSTSYVDSRRKVIAVHPDTWKTIACSTKAQAEFLTSMSEGASGIKFIPMDTGVMAEAVRIQAGLHDGGAVAAKDLLTQVSEESERLIVQASGLAAGASSLQMQVFMSRYAEVQRKLNEAETMLAKARSLVDLAGEAITAIG